MTDWQPISTAPKDGTRFWGRVGDDARAIFWHEGFGEFISSFRRMVMAPGYTVSGKDFLDYSPEIYRPTHWLPFPSPPKESETP
jgi:hypothetical protein